MLYKVLTQNIAGNRHAAATWVNKQGWAEYLVCFEPVSGGNTIAIFKMPLEMVNKIRAETGYDTPTHDDPPQRQPTLAIYPEDELVKDSAEQSYRDNRYTLEIDGQEILRYDGQRFFTAPMNAMERFWQLSSECNGYGFWQNVECYRWVNGVKLERQWIITID